VRPGAELEARLDMDALLSSREITSKVTIVTTLSSYSYSRNRHYFYFLLVNSYFTSALNDLRLIYLDVELYHYKLTSRGVWRHHIATRINNIKDRR
jgi:hypothetical protein